MVFRNTGFIAHSLVVILLTVILGACAQMPDAPHLRPLSPKTYAELAKKGLKPEAPIFVRIFKQESEFELWKAKDDGRFYHFKTYPICKWSGELGPKQFEGDRQAPEGFYSIKETQMKPDSKYHLAFNLGYPNAYDQAHGRTGKHLMVHGDCSSSGCYAMTDALAEEIYVLAREAFKGGQKSFDVHAFPFRMTDEKMKLHQKNKWSGFWKTLKEGYDSFEISRIPPKVDVCNKSYLINASFTNPEQKIDPSLACPAYKKLKPDVFVDAGTSATLKPIEAKANGSAKIENKAGNGLAPKIDGVKESAPVKPATGQEANLLNQKVIQRVHSVQSQ